MEKVIGMAQVLVIFKVSKAGMAAGCRVLDGEIRRNASVRVVRAGEPLFTGEISSLKREKEDVREAREDGMWYLLKTSKISENGDIIESFIMEKFGG